MTQQSFTAKEIFSSLGERLIRVRVANKKNNGWLSLTFPDTEVSGVMENDEKGSALLLRSGVTIPVALPYEELEQKIYRPSFRTDDLVLDLRDVIGAVAKAKPAIANSNEVTTDTLAIGDKMPDGTVFAGNSPDNNKPMYATPGDASLTMTFNDAQKYAAQLDAHGHKDWHVPTKAELNVLFNNRAAIGGFDVTGSNPAGRYWSASPNDEWFAWGQRFSDGAQTNNNKINPSSVRCVR